MQERNHLMKNKKKFAFLTLALTMGLIIGACTSNKSSSTPASSSSDIPASSSISSDVPSSSPSSSVVPSSSSSSIAPSSQSSSSSSSSAPSSSSIPDSSSSSSSSSSSIKSTYTVNFVVNGQTIETHEVNPGELVVFEGDEPTKNPDANAVKYRFKGWDKDLSEPINGDTTITALFAEYAEEIIVDDFENYSGNGALKDSGWAAWTFKNSGWTTETEAAVSLSTNAADGKKALRLDAWRNGMDFKMIKTLEKGTFTKSANAIQFKLMLPRNMSSVKVLLVGEMTIEGKPQAPSFSYVLNQTSGEYMEYTIPLADPGWALWNDPTKPIHEVATWMGVHEDDYLNYLTSIEFYAKGDDGQGGQPYIAFLDSVKFVTLDNPEFSQTQELKRYDRYTGTLADGSTLRVDLASDGSATAKIIDIEVPQTISGSYIIENDQITFTSADGGASLVYKGDITDGGQLVKYNSASGNFANAVLDMNLNAVQVVNNFEQYTESGEAYSQQNYDDTIGSGLRGDFYGEYYTGSGASDWAGNGWQIMPNGDEVNLIKDSANSHSGNNYASFKHFSENAARYISWDLFKGTADKNSFRGSTLGFWAKGYVNKLKVSVYSVTQPSHQNKDKYVKEGSFNEGKVVNDWTHFEIELNPAYVYYGFMFMIDNDYAGDGQLYLDDIEVYTANPYATYQAPEVKKLTQGVSYMAKINDLVAAQLFIRSETQVYLMIPGLESTTIKGTYVFDEVDVTMTFDGDVYVASVSEDMKTFTFKSISGTGKVAGYLNNLSFNLIDYADDAETYDEDGLMYYQGNQDFNKKKGARGAYYCQYIYQGNWILMGGNGDQLQLDTTNHIEGAKSLKMKKSTAGDMRYMEWGLFDGTAKAHTGVSKFTVWLMNPLDSATELKIILYKVQKVTANTDIDENKVVKEITLTANQEWTEYTIDLDPTETYYGYCIYAPQASKTGYFNVDYAYYYNVDNNPNIPYYAKKDMVLNGNLGDNAASIKFDEGGKFNFTCAALGANNVEGSYDIAFVDFKDTVMTLSINNTTIKCLYVVDADYKVTLMIAEVSGAMESYIPVGSTFANQ